MNKKNKLLQLFIICLYLTGILVIQNNIDKSNYYKEVVEVILGKIKGAVILNSSTISLYKMPLRANYEPIQEQDEVSYTDVTHCEYQGDTKSNMDGRAITLVGSKQYELMFNSGMITTNGRGNYVYYHEEIEYYAVALSSIYGKVGDTFRITLSTGNVIYAIKVDEKKDSEVNACGSHSDGSIIEFVIDTNELITADYYENFNGGFQKYDEFKGTIAKIERTN